jgi:hypothetical protein
MRQRRIGTWVLSLLVAVGWLGMPGGAWGQDRSDAPTPRFGTADSIAWAVNGLAFGPSLAVDATLLGVSDQS